MPEADRQVHLIEHPLIDHKLALLREQRTGPVLFRALMREISMLLAYEACRDLPLEETMVETPLEAMPVRRLAEPGPVLISVLRAGNGMLDGALEIIPSAAVGHVGLFRNDALEAVEYYFRVPPDLPHRDVLILDPMLATAGTAVAAVAKVAALEPRSLRFLCVVAAPEGLERFHANHPDVPVYTAAVDRQLDHRGYILPGLGDAGDRLYGTTH